MLNKILNLFNHNKPRPKGPKPVTHPGLVAKMQRDQVRAMGIGIVYGADGVPKITYDFLRNLTYVDRMAVERNLFEHGWKLEGAQVVQIPKDEVA